MSIISIQLICLVRFFTQLLLCCVPICWMLFCCMLIFLSCFFAVCFSAECLCAVCFSAECFFAECLYAVEPILQGSSIYLIFTKMVTWITSMQTSCFFKHYCENFMLKVAFFRKFAGSQKNMPFHYLNSLFEFFRPFFATNSTADTAFIALSFTNILFYVVKNKRKFKRQV